MAKQIVRMVRIAVAVALDQMADVMDALEPFGTATAQMADDSTDDSTADDDGSEVPAAVARQVRRAGTIAASPTARQTVNSRGVAQLTPAVQRRTLNARPGRKVIYTPAGTRKQIDAMMKQLSGMSGAVYADLAKHPGSTNRDVRTRLTKWADKNGFSIESVDNVIWKHVTDGRLKKEAAE